MEMLEYCKTYNIMKSNLSNTMSHDLSSQKTVITVENGQESTFCDGGSVVVETIQRLTGKPGDFALYHSVKHSTKDSDSEAKKLCPLKEISRSRTMISSVKTQQKDVLNFESELTFTPKLNALSIKLAKARGEKMRNSAINRRSSYQNADEETIFTFKPQVSSNSAKIVQKLKTSFLDRQMLHVEKQKKHIQSDSYILPYKSSRLSPVPMIKSKRNRINRSKDLNDSIEEENEETQSYSPSKDSLVTNATDISNSISNSSSTTDVENEKEEENENGNESENGNGIAKESNSIENKTAKNTNITKLKSDSTESGAQRLKEQSPYNQSAENLYLNKQKRAIRAHQRGMTYPVTKPKTENEEWNRSTKIENKKPAISKEVKKPGHTRTSSQGAQYCGKMRYDHPLFEKVRHAKETADTAMRSKKVFICHGPYPIVRASLRRRGFVEKHYQSSPLIKKKAHKKAPNGDSDADSASSDDDSDDNQTPDTSPRGKLTKSKAKGSSSDNKKDGGGGSIGSSDDDDDNDSEDSEDGDWKAGYEDGGPDSEFNLMSRMVRNAVASFIWTVRRDDVDFKYLRKDQSVNHFSRAYSFTTKVGLCSNLRNLTFYEEVDPFTFFPRCHRLGVEEDKLDFIDDFRLGAALSIIKWVISRFENGPASVNALPFDKEPKEETTTDDTVKEDEPTIQTASSNILPVKALTSSLEACRDYLRRQEHLDVDDPIDTTPVTSEALWNEIINYSYQLRQSHTIIASAYPFLSECQNVMNKIKDHMPQIDIDGQRNVWIVKPGAKSRGRGIMCMDRLEDILKLTGNFIGQKEGRWVVQKYIERPLLIYGVKFDIRQWYLVTDWNPLTVWFYQDCYLRFCSHNFSLDDFHVSIHLANNSVQKHFENDSVRDKRLPDENMWSSDEFKTYLRKKGLDNKWEDVIYPGMKNAVIYAMESCQEIVEYRKNSFELYGADFIIGEDFKPWLIEINCSPTMGASTGVTRKLCAQVVEDTMKVVLDRKEDRNCCTGRFELAFKQAQVSAPPYIGVNLAVEGQGIPRKTSVTRRPSTSSKLTSLSRPRDPRGSLTEPRNTRTSSNESRDIKANANESRDIRTSTNDSREPKPSLNESYDLTVNEVGDQSSSSMESFHEKLLVKRHNHKSEKNPNLAQKNNVQKAEGSWALGQLQIPKRLRARSRSGNHSDVKGQGQGVPKGAMPMTIPKAVLRYSNDPKNEPQKPQIPISIGPSQ